MPDNSPVNHIVALAGAATRYEEQPADAAALLIDAAAMLVAEAGVPIVEFEDRLKSSHQMMFEAKSHVEAGGTAIRQ